AVTRVTTPPSTTAASTTVTGTNTPQNAGLSGTAPATSTRYYLSTNTLRDAGDTLLTGARAVPALAAGASSSGPVTVTIPASLPVGSYFLLACADDTSPLPETDETNNCRASTTTLPRTTPAADP